MNTVPTSQPTSVPTHAPPRLSSQALGRGGEPEILSCYLVSRPRCGEHRGPPAQVYAALLPFHLSSPWDKPPAWLQSRMGGNYRVPARKARAHLSAPISLSNSKDGPGWSQAPRLRCLPNDSAQQFCPNPPSQRPSARSSQGTSVLRSASRRPVSTNQKCPQLLTQSAPPSFRCPLLSL